MFLIIIIIIFLIEDKNNTHTEGEGREGGREREKEEGREGRRERGRKIKISKLVFHKTGCLSVNMFDYSQRTWVIKIWEP